MPKPSPEEHSSFDGFAPEYDSYLNQALSATGEGREYFAAGRVRWLAQCLGQLGVRPAVVLDFGCGVGTTAPILSTELGCGSVVGVDSSLKSIEKARHTQASPQIQFFLLGDFQPRADIDCTYCNGVFHHIPVAQRPAALRLIRAALRPEGIFAFWENNPWNPGTQYVMSRCAFDGDAIKISPTGARRMLRQAGFEILRTDSLFFFPKSLAALRPLELALRKIPLGGQYQVLCRKTRDG
jgi:SAM-dependent methyltransferase